VWNDHVKGDKTGSALKRNLLRARIVESEAAVLAFLQERCAVQVLELRGVTRERKLLEHYLVALFAPELNDCWREG
jgi:hypothetical protein